VTHETKHFVYFYIGQVAVQLWKCGWVNTHCIIHGFVV
jgi:hypothetical protein